MNLPVLTADQYLLVQQVLNLTVAFMGGAALLFVLLREQVGRPYRPALMVMAAAVAMACYHYTRILGSWGAAYAPGTGGYQPTGAAFTDAGRYADWIGTVPLILTALLLVLDIGRHKSGRLMVRLVTAAVLMIALGYPGEIQHTDLTARALWGLASMVPFLYIMFVLWGELAVAVRQETPGVRWRVARLRWLLLASWSLHPVVYAFPLLGIGGAGGLVAGQLGHSVIDITAKVIYGLLIYGIAREKTLDAQVEAGLSVPEGAPARPVGTQV